MRSLAWAVLAVGLAAGASSAAPPTRSSGGTVRRVEVLPWIENDYTKAVALARARRVPMFVEAWAPW